MQWIFLSGMQCSRKVERRKYLEFVLTYYLLHTCNNYYYLYLLNTYIRCVPPLAFHFYHSVYTFTVFACCQGASKIYLSLSWDTVQEVGWQQIIMQHKSNSKIISQPIYNKNLLQKPTLMLDQIQFLPGRFLLTQTFSIVAKTNTRIERYRELLAVCVVILRLVGGSVMEQLWSKHSDQQGRFGKS